MKKVVQKMPKGEVHMPKVFLVVMIDNENLDGTTMSVHKTIGSAEMRVRSIIDDPDEKWEQEPDFTKGEDPVGQVLKRWHETTQEYWVQIEQHWVEFETELASPRLVKKIDKALKKAGIK